HGRLDTVRSRVAQRSRRDRVRRRPAGPDRTLAHGPPRRLAPLARPVLPSSPPDPNPRRRGQVPGMSSLEVRDPRLTAIVGPDVTFEKIAGDCLFTEGPLWHPRDRYLLWSDMPGDHLRRWSAADGVTTFRKPCGKSNGLTWDREGRLLACEHATSQVTVTLADGSTRPIATHWDGKQLNSPNDVVCAADGGVYFSDPPYGRAEFFGVPRPQELGFQGVFRAGNDPRSPTLLVDDFDRPNGL